MGAVILLLLMVVVVMLSVLSKKRRTEIPEEEISRIRDSIRHDNEESFLRFQSSLDRDMDKVDLFLKETGGRIENALGRNEVNLSRLSTTLLDTLKAEGELENERTLKSQKLLNENFDRIREENRVSFRDFSEKTEKLTLDALGLTRIGLVRELPDNECTRGQIRKVSHLVALVD